MDALADLLDGAHARGGLFNLTLLDPPWALRIAEGAPLALLTVLRGHAWVMLDDRPPVPVSTGDVAIMCGTDLYTVADDPATSPQFVIHRGGCYTDVDGVDVTNEARLGLRTCGHSMDASMVLVSGTYQVGGSVGGRLLNALPPVLVVPERDARGPVMDMVVAEVTKDDPGQQVVLDRLLDLALITTLRAWFARPEAQAPGWYRAQSDPVVGTALRLLHDSPAVDGSQPRRQGRSVTSGARPPVHRARRRAPDELPHQLADRVGGRPAAGHRRDRGVDRQTGRLCERVRAERGIQAAPRHQSQPAPRHGLRGSFALRQAPPSLRV